jgi:hypothetical protein
MSHKAGEDNLAIVRPKDKPFAITAALISTQTTQRLGRPVEALGSALIKVFGAAAA